MKKFVVLSLFGLLILAFGSIVYGQEKAPVLEFKASGWISIESHLQENVTYPGSGDTNQNTFFGPSASTTFQPNGGAYDKYEAYMEQRGRLKFDAIMGKEMMGTFLFEIDASRWGEIGKGRGQAGNWDTDATAVEVKQMYLTFAVPWDPVPITLQAGLVPIGVRPRVMFANDGPGITAAIKVDPAMIKLMWYKQIENEDYAGDDNDVYGVEANTKIQDFTVGGYVLNFKELSYPFPTVTTSTRDYTGNMWFMGLYADGKAGPVDLTLDFALDNGKIEDHRDRLAANLAKDAKYSGWLTRIVASYPWEKFVFGLVGVYGSGADAKKTSASGMPGVTVGTGAAPYTDVSSKVGVFANTPGNNNGPGDLFVINGHPDFLRGDSGLQGAASGAMNRSYYGGLWYVKLYGSVPVTDIWKVTLGAAYVGDTTKNGNTIGNARKTDGFLRDDKAIGWELDLLNQIQLYKNLTWDIGLGYLAAGKGVDYYNTTTASNDSPKNPFILGTRLAYSF